MTDRIPAWRRSAMALLVAGSALGAQAALKPGDPAPMFKTEAAVAGKPLPFDMAAALQKGPVVLYFFPKAFTQGCTVEANAFAEATPHRVSCIVNGLGSPNCIVEIDATAYLGDKA